MTLATTIATQQDQKFLTEWLGRFTEQTGIQVRTRFYPDQQYANSIQLLFQGDDRPDVFRLVKQPAEMPAAVLKGWIQPLDGFPELITTLERDYPAQARDATTSGLHVGEDLYGMPSLTHRPWGACRPLMYNAALMDKYGVGTPPTTWSELREAAEKITRDAKGEVFGFGLVGQIPEPLGVTVYALQNTAGPQMTDPRARPSTTRPVSRARAILRSSRPLPCCGTWSRARWCRSGGRTSSRRSSSSSSRRAGSRWR